MIMKTYLDILTNSPEARRLYLGEEDAKKGIERWESKFLQKTNLLKNI